MKPDYKNWMPRGMVLSFAATFAASAAALCIARLLAGGTLKAVLTVVFAVLTVFF